MLLVLLIAVGPARAVTFVRSPTARETPEGVRIEFIIDGVTDVTVAVLNADGRVVRHLAAGKLGENAPPPLIKNAYGQWLVWDRRDDTGKPVAPGGYTVRVRLGLRPTFRRLIGASRGGTGRILGLAVHPTRGDLSILGSLGGDEDGTAVVQVRDSTGRYLRTILPYPAALRPSQVGGLRLSGGGWVPRVYNGYAHALMPGLGVPLRQTMVVTSQGELIFGSGAAPWGGGQRRLLGLNADGTWPVGGVGGPLLPEAGGTGHLHLALSPDEAYLYASGLRQGTGQPHPLQVVYRLRPRGGSLPEPWLGESGRSGKDERHFDDPRGLATDPAGNVYVADHNNDRICVFAPTGRWLGAIPCTQPDQIFVHPKTGHIYVLTLDQTERQMLTYWNAAVAFRKKGVVKLAGWQPRTGQPPGPAAGRVLAALDLPRREGYPVLALDPAADPPVLWYSEGLSRIEDAGNKFKVTGDVVSPDPQALTACAALCVDRTREEVYVDTLSATDYRWVRYGGLTGRCERFPLRGREAGRLTAGPDGLIYVRSPRRVSRFDRDGHPAPVVEGGTHRLDLSTADALDHECDFTVGANGDIYLLRRTESGADAARQIDVYAADGAVKAEGLVSGLTPAAAAVRVDPANNIYVADGITPGHETAPRTLSGQIMPRPGEPNWYALLHGSVVKFGPRGGTVKRAAAGQTGYVAVTPEGSRTYRVTGAAWVKPVCGPVLYADRRRYWCTSSFDVDGFGRAFVPQALSAQVVVLDAGGNEITRFGTYGNADAPANVRSDVPLAWPAHVAVSDSACTIADPLNGQIVSVELKYAQEASVLVTVK